MAESTVFQNRRLRVTPPDKGSFPLDHIGICQRMRDVWTDCMKDNNWDSVKCRGESAAYLRCRIDNKLMSPEEVEKLGFNQNEWSTAGQIYHKE